VRTITLVLPKTNTGTCRSCSAQVDWYATPAGKAMPMNAGSVHLRTTGGGPAPELGEFDTADTHWATCPDAGKWKART
jgi:hypothetical protein